MKTMFAILTCTILGGIALAQPTTDPATQPAVQVAKPFTIITRDQWGSRPLPAPAAKKHEPKVLTLHHAGVTWRSGDPFVSIRNLQTFSQNDKKWFDVPYHFLIAPDGRVFEGRDVNYEPDTNTKYELKGVLNIELMGNFEEQRISPEQLRSTVLLIAKLCRELKLDPATIRGHNDAAPGQTSCPGRDFHRYIANGSIRAWVDVALRGEEPQIEELPALRDGPTTRISTTMPSEAAN